MYRVRPLVPSEEAPQLPACMYRVRPLGSDTQPDLRISQQVVNFLKTPMKEIGELEKRQDHLLQQLDILYERIKNLSSLCKTQSQAAVVGKQHASTAKIASPDEIVINASAENLPYFLLLVAKCTLKYQGIRLTYHIHSSIPNTSVQKIKEFMKQAEIPGVNGYSVHVKLIFKDVAANTELKLSSTMTVPIIGEVNILRYLSYIFPDALPYDESYEADALLDLCYLLQRPSTESSTIEPTLKKLFGQSGGGWIHGNQLSIVDIAAYSVVKQMNRVPKVVPKPWLEKCSQLVKA